MGVEAGEPGLHGGVVAREARGNVPGAQVADRMWEVVSGLVGDDNAAVSGKLVDGGGGRIRENDSDAGQSKDDSREVERRGEHICDG